MFQLNLFQDDVPLKKKPGEWSFLAKICEKHLWKIKILSKDAGHRPIGELTSTPLKGEQQLIGLNSYNAISKIWR